METLEKNVRAWTRRLNDASGAFGGVEICAVSKTVPAERINPAWDAGIRILGENRVQEVLEKRDSLNPGFRIELIGRLQTNKVAKILPAVRRIQSLDREALLLEIDRRAQALGICMPVLVQVNIAREAQKAGVFEEDLAAFVRKAAACPGVQVEGLMAVMPLVEDPEEVRPYFRKMRQWFEKLREMHLEGVRMCTLSMGMSGDCLVAAQEGATMVRLGRALFGDRN